MSILKHETACTGNEVGFIWPCSVAFLILFLLFDLTEIAPLESIMRRIFEHGLIRQGDPLGMADIPAVTYIVPDCVTRK